MYELDAPLFDLAAELEGHPDNVAAALLGGFVVCARASPCASTRRAGLEGVLAIPPFEVPTAEARAALPAEVPLGDAVHNVGHASLLVLGLARGDFSLIGRGLPDALHQPRRRTLYPRSMELVERADELGAVGATISGAGPTVLFWCHWEQTGSLVERLRAEAAGLRGAARDLRARRGGRAMSSEGSRRRAGWWWTATAGSPLVHRPRYDDWTLPKGKLDPARRSRRPRCGRCGRRRGCGCAARCASCPTTKYTVRGPPEGRALLADGASSRTPGFEPNAEVDELRWLSPADAAQLLTYDRDKEVLEAAAG